jgi:DNA-binding CsgD family transcriptional regulator
VRDVQADALSRLIERAYSAGLDPVLWQDFLNDLDAEIDGAYLSIYGYDAISKISLPSVSTRYPPEMMELYQTQLYRSNPFIPVLLRAPRLQSRVVEAWLDKQDLIRSEFYNEFLGPIENLANGAGGVVFNDAGRMFILNGHIPLRYEDRKAERLNAFINLLMPHVGQAFALHRRLALTDHLAQAHRTLLDRAASPAYLIDASQRVLWYNAAAEAMRDLVVVVGARGVLGFAEPATQRRFEAALRALLHSDPPTAAPPFPIGGSGWYASMVPLSRQLPPALAWAPLAPAALLVLSSPRRVPNELWPVYAAEVGLTPAECDLAEALAAGLSLSDQAERRGSSLHTVRAQAKALFAKTGTHGQVALIAALARFFH